MPREHRSKTNRSERDAYQKSASMPSRGPVLARTSELSVTGSKGKELYFEPAHRGRYVMCGSNSAWLNSFPPLSLHRNILTRARRRITGRIARENMRGCSLVHTLVRNRTPRTQTKRVLGGIKAHDSLGLPNSGLWQVECN